MKTNYPFSSLSDVWPALGCGSIEALQPGSMDAGQWGPLLTQLQIQVLHHKNFIIEQLNYEWNSSKKEKSIYVLIYSSVFCIIKLPNLWNLTVTIHSHYCTIRMPVFRIRIRRFLSLQDPDPLALDKGTDPDDPVPDPSISVVEP